MLTRNSVILQHSACRQIHAARLQLCKAVPIAAAILLALPVLSACSLPSGAGISPPTTSVSEQKTNRLIHETSPYLLEHSHDPVDWYPWGDEAFKKAKKENKPILLSVGYLACHWCHVMHRESFQDQATASIMNQNFVNIKVDREERPDVDEIYMRAVQAITGRGGWPATIFLTPDLKPFYAGTYFPNKDMLGLPSFQKVLISVKQAWNQDPAKQTRVGDEVASIISAIDVPSQASAAIGENTVSSALQPLLLSADTAYGGIGGSMKFPLSGPISLCMRAMASGSTGSQHQLCESFVTTTLDKMAYGGIHDHIGGGFFRYATDRQWRIPHFEKMLYDNAAISQNYLDGYQITGKAYWAQTARDTLDFCLAELRSPDGAFFSSLDADSQGEEGAFYTYTRQQLADILGKQDANSFADSFSATADGNFQDHKNVLYLSDSPEALARRDGLSVVQFQEKVAALREKLLAKRNDRPRPQRDEKVIAGWNALMVSSLVRGYKVLGDKKYLLAATKTAQFLTSRMSTGNHLHHVWAANTLAGEGYLDDYALTVQALLDLASADANPIWLAKAKSLNEVILQQYGDEKTGDFFYTATYQNQPICRTRNSSDSSTPSGTAIEVLNLLRLGQITGNSAYLARAEQVLKSYSAGVVKDPIASSSMLNALEYFLHSKTSIITILPASGSVPADISATVFGTYSPNTSMLLFRFSDLPKAPDSVLKGKKPIDGATTVYVCEDMVCDKPITDAATLKRRLMQLSQAHKL